jgi:ribosomal protein L11 methyltransferase
VTWALHTNVDLESINLHLQALEAAGLLGIAEQHGRATVYLRARSDDLPVPGRWEHVPERDWNEVWKRGLEPVRVGAVVIVPPWLSPAVPAGGLNPPHPRAPGAIVIEPGQAFGTGHHETTVGCLAALQELDLHGRRLLDVGTGTGVLAICAARLGAEVVAVDTDRLAVEAARANAARNGVVVSVRQGSIEASRGELFDVVVANIDTATLTAHAAELVAALGADCTLIASGVSRERAQEAAAALARAGVPVTVREGREWVVLVGRSPSTPETEEDGGH